jgi:hypothetical protein
VRIVGEAIFSKDFSSERESQAQEGTVVIPGIITISLIKKYPMFVVDGEIDRTPVILVVCPVKKGPHGNLCAPLDIITPRIIGRLPASIHDKMGNKHVTGRESQ